jgi:hydroxymethylpyrimidine/phosphomethylpyrimidine kinase
MAIKPRVVVVGGTDSSGGAGVSRDIETLAAFGVEACPAVTAVTVQTHDAVERVELLPGDLVGEQMAAAVRSGAVAAIKIGMLGRAAAVHAVAGFLKGHPHIPAVLDPVLVSTSGGMLMDDDAVLLLSAELLPRCMLVTPNLPELAVLTGQGLAESREAIARQGGALLAGGCRAVLVKGGHGSGPCSTDILFAGTGEPVAFSLPRLKGSMRGTGCMLASACAAGLASGDTLEDSIRSAKRYVFERISETLRC